MSPSTYKKDLISFLFRLALLAGLAASSIVLLAYCYLGIFSRYRADDFCHAYLFASPGVFAALVNRYLAVSNRFSSFLFVGVTELFHLSGVAVLPTVMLVSWVIGLTWMISESRKWLAWNWSSLVDWFLACTCAFFSFLQAPNLYQTIYWRASMATHFAPIVFITFLAAYLLRQIRKANTCRPAWWVNPAAFAAAFLAGGFSEPPAVFMVVGLGLIILLIWKSKDVQFRQFILRLLAWTLAGATAAFLVMFISPANAFRLKDVPPPGFGRVILLSLQYTFEFILATLRTLPLPSALSVIVPALTLYGLSPQPPFRLLSPGEKTRLLLAMVVLPLIAYGLIATSFAPSVYGQSFPVPRTRFLGRFLMTTSLMTEGGLLGALATQFRVRFLSSRLTSGLTAILLLMLAIYPLRAAGNILHQVPKYQTQAARWDVRDAHIRMLKSQGVMDIVVKQLPGIYNVKELDINPHHWVNQCAAHYYGVNSISTSH